MSNGKYSPITFLKRISNFVKDINIFIDARENRISHFLFFLIAGWFSIGGIKILLAISRSWLSDILS